LKPLSSSGISFGPFLAVLLVVCTLFLQAAFALVSTFTSNVASGNWTDKNTWSLAEFLSNPLPMLHYYPAFGSSESSGGKQGFGIACSTQIQLC
jgi:hypothetical protein